MPCKLHMPTWLAGLTEVIANERLGSHEKEVSQVSLDEINCRGSPKGDMETYCNTPKDYQIRGSDR